MIRRAYDKPRREALRRATYRPRIFKLRPTWAAHDNLNDARASSSASHETTNLSHLALEFIRRQPLEPRSRKGASAVVASYAPSSGPWEQLWFGAPFLLGRRKARRQRSRSRFSMFQSVRHGVFAILACSRRALLCGRRSQSRTYCSVLLMLVSAAVSQVCLAQEPEGRNYERSLDVPENFDAASARYCWFTASDLPATPFATGDKSSRPMAFRHWNSTTSTIALWRRSAIA